MTAYDKWKTKVPDDEDHDLPEGFDTWEEYERHCAEIASEEAYENR